MGQLYRLDFSSGKSYVGVSRVSAVHRFKKHEHDAHNGSRVLVGRAWRKHGRPRLIVLATIENYDLLSCERRAVTVFNTQHPNGYNMTPGGDISPTTVPEIAARVSAATKGVPRPYVTQNQIGDKNPSKRPEVRAKIAASRIGMKLSNEHKAKISEAGKGRKNSPETRAKIAAAISKPEAKAKMLAAAHRRIGAKRTLEQRARMAASHLGHIMSEETRRKMSLAKLGKKFTQEHKDRIAAAKRRYWESQHSLQQGDLP